MSTSKWDPFDALRCLETAQAKIRREGWEENEIIDALVEDGRRALADHWIERHFVVSKLPMNQRGR